jgi:hypothetical protein
MNRSFTIDVVPSYEKDGYVNVIVKTIDLANGQWGNARTWITGEVPFETADIPDNNTLLWMVPMVTRIMMMMNYAFDRQLRMGITQTNAQPVQASDLLPHEDWT